MAMNEGMLDDLRHRVEAIQMDLAKLIQAADFPNKQKRMEDSVLNAAMADLFKILDNLAQTSSKTEYMSFPGYDRGAETVHGVIHNEKLRENAWARLKQGLDYPGVSRLAWAMTGLKEMIGAYVSASTDPIQGIKPEMATGGSARPVHGHP